MAPRNYARLNFEYWNDPLMEVVADESPAAIAIWPILICLAKKASGEIENPTGIIKIVPRGIAKILRDIVTDEQVSAALKTLEEAELIMVEKGKKLLFISLLSFTKWQTSRGSNSERQQHHRDQRDDVCRDFMPDSNGRVTDRNGSVTVPRANTDTDTDTKSIKKNKQKKSLTAPEVMEVFSYWKDAFSKRADCILDAKRSKKLSWAITHYGVDRCKLVVDGYLKDPWEGRRQNSDVVQLFRDASTIEKGIDLASSTVSTVASSNNSLRIPPIDIFKHQGDW